MYRMNSCQRSSATWDGIEIETSPAPQVSEKELPQGWETS